MRDDLMDTVERTGRAIRVTWMGFVLNVLLSGLKIAAGIFGRSSALLADGVHSISDFATDLGVIFGFHMVKKPVDEDHQFGHGKIETLITTLIGLVLIGVSLGILYSGLIKINEILEGGSIERPGWIALGAAGLSIILKEWVYRVTRKEAERIDSSALLANAWHHRSDALSSIGTFAGVGGAILLGGVWTILDPIAAVLVSFLIFRVGAVIIRDSVYELLEGSLDEGTKKRIIEMVMKNSSIQGVHGLRTRKVGSRKAMEMHIQLCGHLTVVESHDIATEVEDMIRREYGEETFITIHIEPCGEHDDCRDYRSCSMSDSGRG